MKFGGIFNKKGSDKNGFKEDLAVSDPGSDDSWNALYNKVPEKNSIQGLSEAALPQSNPTEGFAATPSSVNKSPVGNNIKEKGGRKSADKNALKNTKISTCKKSKQCNLKSLIPVTSTPFLSEKRIPSFKVSPIISTVNGTNNIGCQEGTSPFADSTVSLVVKRNNPTKHVDAFDQLLDPSKNKLGNTTSIFPGIVPLKSVVNQADTTRQYAGGIIRGVKTFQDQFTEYAYNDSQNSLKEKSTEKVHSLTNSVNCRSRGTRKSHGTHTGTAPAQNERKDEQVMQICKKSILEHTSQNSGNPSEETSLRRSTRGLISNEILWKSVQEENRSLIGRLQNNPLNVITVPKVTEINSNKHLKQSAPPKTYLKLSGSKQVNDPGSPAKESNCLRIDQKSESGVTTCLRVDDKSLKRTELIERQPIQGDGERNSLAKSRKKVNDCIEQPNKECHSPTEESRTCAKMTGGDKLCFGSAFEIHIGNNCLKQSNLFSFALPQNHKDQSDQALPSKRIESVERDQLRDGEGCKRVQEEPIKNKSQEMEENPKLEPSKDVRGCAVKSLCVSPLAQVEDIRNINPSEDVCHQEVESQRLSLISESNMLEPSVKKIEMCKSSQKFGVGCSPSKSIAPSTIEILNKPSPEGVTWARPVAEKTNIVIETPSDTAANSNGVSSSEEERILLRAQSLKLRENQSNSSRVTKSPKIIDTGPLGGNSKVLGRKLRFSVPLQSPPKNSEGANNNATQKGILSHHIRFDKTLNQEHEYIPPDNEAPNISCDSSFDVGVFLSRNPVEMQKTFNDNFELEIMSSSEEENRRSKKHKKHKKRVILQKILSSEEENKQSKKLKTDDNLQNVQKTTKFQKGANLSSRVKEIRRRKEAQIEALRNSKGDDSDSDPVAEKEGSVKTLSSKPGSGKKSSENKTVHKVKGHVRHMKTSTENTTRERNISPMHARGSLGNVHETPDIDDIGLFNEELEKDTQTEEDQYVQTGSQNESKTKQLKNSDIKTDRKNRAMKMQDTKQSGRKQTEERYTHLSIPSDDNEEQVADTCMFNEELKKDSETEEDRCVQTGLQNESKTKQLKNSDIKTDRKNRAMKIHGTKQSSRQNTEKRYNHLSIPSNDNEEQVTDHRYSRRVRKPPSMYWLGKKSRNTDNDFGSHVNIEKYNPTQPSALVDDDESDRRKSKSQKRKVSKSSKPNIMKVPKKMKSNLESCPSSDLKNVLIGSVKQDLSCSINEMQEFRCVQGSGLKGDMLALGVGAKYKQVFHNHNQVFYVLEGDISYECSNDKATLVSGSFFIVPHDTQYIITNMSNSTAKLVVVTCKM